MDRRTAVRSSLASVLVLALLGAIFPGGPQNGPYAPSRIEAFNIEGAALADDGKWCAKVARAAVLLGVSAETTANTATVQVYDRDPATPNTGTTGMLSSGLAATSTNTAETAAFAASTLSAKHKLCIGVTATTLTTSDVLHVYVEVADQ